MPRRYSTREVERFLRTNGFAMSRQSGSHRRWTGQFRGRSCYVTVVAGQKQIPDATLAGIASQLHVSTPEL